MSAKKLIREMLLRPFRTRTAAPLRRHPGAVGRRIEELEDRTVPVAGITGLTPSLSGGVLASGTASFQLTFSEGVTNANVSANYQLVSTGADGLLGTGDDVPVTVSASAGSSTTASLSFAGLSAGVYRLTVSGVPGPTAITSTVDSTTLDGDADGNPGGNWVRDFVVGANTTTLTSPNGFTFDPVFGGSGAGQLVQGTNNAFDGLNRLQVGGTDYTPGVPTVNPASILAEVTGSASAGGSYADVAGLGSTVNVSATGTVVRVSDVLDGLTQVPEAGTVTARLVVDGVPTTDLAVFRAGNVLVGTGTIPVPGGMLSVVSTAASVQGFISVPVLNDLTVWGGQLTFEKYLSLGQGAHTVQVQVAGNGTWDDARLTAVALLPVGGSPSAAVAAEVVTASASGTGSYADVAGLSSTVNVAQAGTVVRVSGVLDGLTQVPEAGTVTARLVVDGVPTTDLAVFRAGNVLVGTGTIPVPGGMLSVVSTAASVQGFISVPVLNDLTVWGGQLTFEKYLSLGQGAHTVQVQVAGNGTWNDARLTAVAFSSVPTPTLDDGGRTVLTPSQTLSGLQVSRDTKSR